MKIEKIKIDEIESICVVDPIFIFIFQKLNEIIDHINGYSEQNIENEILGCPFCSNKPEIAISICLGAYEKYYVVQCKNINCPVKPKMHSDTYKTEQEAIKAWNKRVTK